jgi:hypothetical protein
MIGRVTSPCIYIQDTGSEKGRGVYAGRDFQEGELIEAAPVLILFRPFTELPPRIRQIVYNWGELTKGPPASAAIYGYGSLYNHDNPANIRYKANAEEEVMNYFAARDIVKDEELTVNYNAAQGEPISEKDDWFELHGIQPITG